MLQLYDTVNTHGGLFAYNTVIDNDNSSGAISNASAQQLIVKNNIFYNTNSTGFYYVLRFYKGYRTPFVTPINQRNKIDYNLYYQTNSSTYNWEFDQANGSIKNHIKLFNF